MPQVEPSTIRQVPEGRIHEAVAQIVLMGKDPAGANADHFLDFARLRGIDLDQCWGCLDADDRYTAVCLAVPNPGRTALVFVSPARTERAMNNLAELVHHAHAHMDPSRIALAQGLFVRDETRQQQAFAKAGYSRLAELSYLERRIPKSDRNHLRVQPPTWPDGVAIEHWNEQNADKFKKVLADSYIETRDCPGLCGLRSIDDILQGHLHAGVFDPELWTLVNYKGDPAAVLLLNVMTDYEVVELSYIGVGVAFRRLGLGRRLVQWGLCQASQQRLKSMTLAVDEANEPALKMYRALGFYRTDRRIAYIQPVPAPQAAPSTTAPDANKPTT